MPTDIEIARSVTPLPITEVAKNAGVDVKHLIPYGFDKAKVDYSLLNEPTDHQAKLVLVTAINPTPAGEGKTTTTIGLADGLRRRGVKSAVALREPSLGPVFGVKGGAAGGGWAQVIPMEDINLHFTGDFHAIGAANNLLAAMLDNHIQQGNQLGIDVKRITWKRVVDMNDRQLRHVIDGIGGKAQGAMAALLKDALKPNLVQTLEGTPAFVHGGPFANIAHGCNSIMATRMAMRFGDVAITEAGFGADLGAEKFLDIKCRMTGVRPSAVVVVATARALKYNGGVAKADLNEENLEALKAGMPNLLRHVDNIQNVYGLPCVVAINRFPTDTEAELALIESECQKLGVNVKLSEVWAKGGEGALELADEVMRLIEQPSELKFAYEDGADVADALEAIATKVYRADGVDFTPAAKRQLAELRENGFGNLPVCVAKTQYSFSDNAKALGAPENFRITVRELKVSAGAHFVVALTGSVLTMPGLPKVPAAENIDVDNDGNITGLF